MFTLSSNTDDSGITYVDDVFSAYTYTGNGSTQTINNGIDLAGKGGLVWTKSRSVARSNYILDTTRTNNAGLSTNLNFAAFNDGTITPSSTGYSIVESGFNDGFVNVNTEKYVSWTFRKAPKFFDVVTYTGDGTSNRNVTHSLGVKPGFVIIKRTDSVTWGDWHVSARCSDNNYAIGASGTFGLNLTGVASGTNANPSFTSTTVNVDNVTSTNGVCNVSGASYVAYLFAHDTAADGIIQCGSFTTDASGNAAVNLGWEPQFIIAKASSAALNWYISDIARGMPVGSAANALFANLSNAEQTGYTFTPTATGVNVVASTSQTFIYMAIRRPNKPPTSGAQVFMPLAFAYAGGIG